MDDWHISDKRPVDVDALMTYLARRKFDKEYDEVIQSFRDAVAGHRIHAPAGLLMIKTLQREREWMWNTWMK
jgi:hypothetical protein